MKKYVAWALVVAWMVLIYNFSAQSAEGSKELSTGLVQEVVEAIERFFLITPIDSGMIHIILRKGAHLFLYFALGVFVYQAMSLTGDFNWTILISLIICTLYGASDEIHQMFVPNRGPKVMDVFIDAFGAYLGIILTNVMIILLKKRKKTGQT